MKTSDAYLSILCIINQHYEYIVKLYVCFYLALVQAGQEWMMGRKRERYKQASGFSLTNKHPKNAWAYQEVSLSPQEKHSSIHQ